MKFSLKKIQNYISEPLPEVSILREKIIFHAFEVESVENLGQDDYELDIKILPDRAGDAKDERGMAREIAALLKLSLKEPDSYEKGNSISFGISRIARLLGRKISESDIRKVFDAYHYQYEISDDTVKFFTPPWRNDLANVHDIADEIGRYLGYDTVDAVLPEISHKIEINSEFATITAKKNEMILNGYNEVMTYSLVKKGDFQVAKGPKGKDFLRTNLLGELRKSYELNKQNSELLPNHSANIFEIGRVFPKTGEELHVAWIDEAGEHEEALDVSNILDRYDLPKHESEARRFQMWSEFPFIVRDVALWILETDSPNRVFSVLRENAGELLVQEPRLFDTFTKNGKTSVAFRLVFQSFERTLTNEEVDKVMDHIYYKVKANGWDVR